MKIQDPIAAFAALNPVSAEEVELLERAAERDGTLALIKVRRNELVSQAPVRSRRAIFVAIALAAALAVPALALSGVFDSLFGFSNHGTSVDQSKLDLRAASALDITGADKGTVKLLVSRGGVGVYLAHDKSGDPCFFLGPPNASDLGAHGLSGGCMTPAPSGFPSPQEPVIDMTLFEYRPGTVGEEVGRLAGIAADGVAKIEVLDMDCQVITEAPVADNVYLTTDVPKKPAAAIVGLDATGNRVYLDKLRFWDQSSCATNGGK